jgi:hypothetical protein
VFCSYDSRVRRGLASFCNPCDPTRCPLAGLGPLKRARARTTCAQDSLCLRRRPSPSSTPWFLSAKSAVTLHHSIYSPPVNRRLAFVKTKSSLELSTSDLRNAHHSLLPASSSMPTSLESSRPILANVSRNLSVSTACFSYTLSLEWYLLSTCHGV